jgi:hypothetical protein
MHSHMAADLPQQHFAHEYLAMQHFNNWETERNCTSIQAARGRKCAILRWRDGI